MIGITEGMKEFDFVQTTACQGCGRYGRYIVYMTYTVLSLFFIPCIKWNKRYYVRMSCCGKTYQLDPEVGKRIARGEDAAIGPEDLTEDYGGAGYNASFYDGQGYSSPSTWANWKNEVKTCDSCGYQTDEDFDYCPKCGRKF